MIVGGGVLLSFYSDLGHHGTFAIMAALTALASIPVLATSEPAPAPARDAPPEIHFLSCRVCGGCSR